MNFKGENMDKQREGYTVPEGYFDSFTDAILMKQKIVDEGFKVPEDYFKNLDVGLPQKNVDQKVVRLPRYWKLVAASFALLVSAYIISNSSQDQDFVSNDEELFLDYMIANPTEIFDDEIYEMAEEMDIITDETYIEYIENSDFEMEDFIEFI